MNPKWDVYVNSESKKFYDYLKKEYKNCSLNLEDGWRVGLPDFLHMKMTSYFTSKRNNLSVYSRRLASCPVF
jgi:hypothetical protein